MIDIDRDHFELLVERALEMIPDELSSKITNVAVIIEDESPRIHQPCWASTAGFHSPNAAPRRTAAYCPIRSRSIAIRSWRSVTATKRSLPRFGLRSFMKSATTSVSERTPARTWVRVSGRRPI